MKEFWALIRTDQEMTNTDQMQEICNEIEGKVDRVIQVTPGSQDILGWH